MNTLLCNVLQLKHLIGLTQIFNLDNYFKDFAIGCFLEVIDLDYPDELHDLHNEYPLASQITIGTEEMLPKYQLEIIEDNIFLGINIKLILYLGNKRKYEFLYQTLTFYSNLGLQLKKFIEHYNSNKKHF